MGIATRVNGQPPPDIALSDIDLGTLEFWALDDDVRDGAFATLRREAPIKFFRQAHMEGVPDGAGHWALMKFDDVFFASRHPDIFSSYPNITIPDQMPEVAGMRTGLEILIAAQASSPPKTSCQHRGMGRADSQTPSAW